MGVSRDVGREGAADARSRAAADRDQAAEDRRHAAGYRIKSQQEQAALIRQVAISETDSLTGARARAPGLVDLEIEINRVQRSTGELAVAYVDVVGLKSVNDTRGHAAGDSILEEIVRLIRSHLRVYDLIIRVGGDEFVCVMSGSTIEDARRRFDGIQRAASAIGLGIKFGVAALRPGDGPSDLIERADSQLLPGPRPPVSRPSRPASSPEPRAERGQPRILVTDYRPEMAAIVEDALADRYSCKFARNEKEAREMLAGDEFELLVCDLHSDAESTISLAQDTVAQNRDTAVILIAENDDPEAAKLAFGFGAYGYVVRPLPGQLLITTMNALRRRELEIAHRESSASLAERRQTIIDMVPLPIYAKDLSGHYVIANAKADELAGLPRGALLGMVDDDFLSPEERKFSLASDRQVLKDRTSHGREDTVVIHDVAKTFKSIRFPLLDEDGEISAVGGISVDITAEREAVRLHEELAAAQIRAIDDLELSRRETIRGLAKAIGLHDSSTAQHVERMAAIAGLLGAHLGLDPDRIELLEGAAAMHDVGKIGTPAEILRKSGTLSAAERQTMQRHTTIGHEIFADCESDLSKMAATIALTHHERYDGGGYPNGIAGEEIPLEGRIAAVADVFDALLSDRSYRPAMSVKEAMAIIVGGKGTHFDPRIVDALVDNLDEALSIRAGFSCDGDVAGLENEELHMRRGGANRRGSDQDGRGLQYMEEFEEALAEGVAARAETVAKDALDGGLSVEEVYSRVITPAMGRIGDRWQSGEVSIAGEHLATAISQGVMARLFPSLLHGELRSRQRVMLAAVQGEQHVLGLRMIADTLEGAGFDVLYLGADVPLAALLEACQDQLPAVLGMSVSMWLNVPTLVAEIEELAKLEHPPAVFIGGRAAARAAEKGLAAPVVEGCEQVVEVVTTMIDRPSKEPPVHADLAARIPPYHPRPRGAGECTESVAGSFAMTALAAADNAREASRRAFGLETLAYHDGLTGLWNRRAYDDRVIELFETLQSRSPPREEALGIQIESARRW